MSEANADPGVIVHMGIAEQGKVHALAGEHRLALGYYREAMRLATARQAPELFFRHYLECMIESLEQTGAYAEVLAYCEKAVAHHRGLRLSDPEQIKFAALDLAGILQRQAVVLVRLGKPDDARDALRRCLESARRAETSLKVAENVYSWLSRGYQVDVRRLEQELQVQGYYTVREETVVRQRAIRLPDLHLKNLGLA